MEFAGRSVTIEGRNGRVVYCTHDGQLRTSATDVRRPVRRSPDGVRLPTAPRLSAQHPREAAEFVVEHHGSGKMALKSARCGLYVTAHMYGDQMRNSTAQALATASPLRDAVDLVSSVVDMAVAPGGGFEGQGFDYAPLALQEGPPSFEQVFRIEEAANAEGKHALKTQWGSFWRSCWWESTVTQAPHCLADETWGIHLADHE